MTLLRIVLNALIIGSEIAAVAAIAWLGLSQPVLFAAATAALSLALGLRLEHARLRHELPFYFGRLGPTRFMFTHLVGFLEAVLKAVLAGLAALFTFSGTDPQRLVWVAIVFGLCVYAGASLLRVLSLKLDALPSRWGYFRLAPPLGLLFSAGIAILAAHQVIPAANITDIGWKIVFELPPRPNVEQVSELFFQLKQAFDDFIVRLLSAMMSRDWAQVASVVVSVNVLSGFVASVYAALIAAMVRRLEAKLP